MTTDDSLCAGAGREVGGLQESGVGRGQGGGGDSGRPCLAICTAVLYSVDRAVVTGREPG